MNCKPGDLAVIVVPASFDQFLSGKVVQVAADGVCDIGTMRVVGDSMGHAWMCHFDRPWKHPDTPKPIAKCWIYDSWLRPIRNNDGEDETLTWAGKPSDIKEPSHA